MNTLAEEFADVIFKSVNKHSHNFNKTDWQKVPVETFFVGGLKIDLETLRLIECANVIHLLGGESEVELKDAKLAKYLQQYFPHIEFKVPAYYRPIHDPSNRDWFAEAKRWEKRYSGQAEYERTKQPKPPLGERRTLTKEEIDRIQDYYYDGELNIDNESLLKRNKQ